MLEDPHYLRYFLKEKGTCIFEMASKGFCTDPVVRMLKLVHLKKYLFLHLHIVLLYYCTMWSFNVSFYKSMYFNNQISLT